MPIKILALPKWIVGGISGFVGAIVGTLTGSAATKPNSSPDVPDVPLDATPPVDIIPDVIEAVGAMSTTDLLIVLGIGMLAIYGLLAFLRGPR